MHQRGVDPKEDDTLVYTSPQLPIRTLAECPSLRAIALTIVQIQHSTWTPARLRRLARTRLYGDHPDRELQSRLRNSFVVRWAKGVAQNEPHAVESWPSIVDAWAHGGDPVEVAERFFMGRRWAYELVSRYLRAASFYAFADDLRAGVCRQTHGESGGGGRTLFRDGAGLFAETCSACVLLRGADWEGWVAIEESG